jgi:hypothetical protein
LSSHHRVANTHPLWAQTYNASVSKHHHGKESARHHTAKTFDHHADKVHAKTN